MKKIDFSDRMEAEKYFCGVVEQMRGVKVKAVFSCCPSFGDYDGIRQYIEDNEIYILFENDICLVISYRFIDALRVEMRALSDDERAWYEEAVIKDYFNDETKIYRMLPDGGAELEKTCKISLDYDCVENIELKRKSLPYLKWDGPSSIAEVEPKLSTFECITFVMKNGNTFAICPQPADTDGYTDVWSADAVEVVTKGECKNRPEK